MRWPDLTKKTFAMLWHLRHWFQYQYLDNFLIVFFFLAFVVLSPIFTVLVAPCPIVVPSFSWQRHISVICISPRSSLRHSDYGLAEIPPPFCQRNIKIKIFCQKSVTFARYGRQDWLGWEVLFFWQPSLRSWQFSKIFQKLAVLKIF